MIKLIAFDWNGTLFADTNLSVKACSDILEHFGYPRTTVKEYQDKFTIPIRDYWMNMGLDPDLFDREGETIESIFLKSYEPLENKARSRTGAKEILKWLKYQNIKVIIYSNHIVPHIEKQLRRLKLHNLIDAVLARPLGDRTQLHSKHKDQKLNEYIRSININPKNILTVGDTDEEIEIAKQFGYHIVAITGGYHSGARLKKAKPDFLIHNLSSLKDIIIKLNRTNQVTRY